MTEQFISEAIAPVTATSDTSRMARGEPGLPREFIWRGETIRITTLLRAWRETGPCSHGSPEVYARKHWYEVLTDSGRRMKLYAQRQARGRAGRANRWWLFSVEEPEEASPGGEGR